MLEPTSTLLIPLAILQVYSNRLSYRVAQSRFPSIWQLSLTLSNQESTFVVMLVNQEKSKSAVKNH